MNMFLHELTRNDALTWNGAVSNSTSGCSLLDYFAKCGSYRGRSMDEVSADMASLFGTDPVKAMKIVLYNRMVTRKSNGFDKVQRGQGQKDEFIKSLVWLERNYPDVLFKNLHLIPVIGCWKDLWYDSASTGFFHYVAPGYVYALVSSALQDVNERALVAKYLPKIRSKSNVKTARHERLNRWARGLCQYLGWTEKQYRKFKSDPSNTAHSFQRVMCNNEWDKLDFNKIPGRALFSMVNGNVMKTHDLENRYLEWIKSQPVAKFTGYPYELYRKAKGPRTIVQKYTYDKQFEKLIEVGKDSIPEEVLSKGVLCALDTSGSMSGGYGGHGGPAPIDVCVGLGIYFSKFLSGAFKDTVVMFDNRSRTLKLHGSFCDRVDRIARYGWAMGGTNFQSVIDEIVRVRKTNPNIPVSDFPEVLLVVSDMQFNPTEDWRTVEITESDKQSNYEVAKQKLASVGLPPMSIIWWQVNGRFTSDVPSTMFDPGTTLISGFDPSIVTAILGGQGEVVDEETGESRKLTPYEQMDKALDQDVLNLVS